jgi:CRP-like cAMP-binding protein
LGDEVSTPSSEHIQFLRRLDSLADLASDDRAALAALSSRVKPIAEKRDIAREGSRPAEICMVIEGIVCSYKMLSNGRRQILAFHFAGDVPGLQSLHLKTMDHTLSTLTAARVGYVQQDEMKALVRARPGVAEALSRLSMVDASISREWIANIGRRSSLERVAHLICECFARMRVLGLCKASDFELPLTQVEISDATGLSVVHVNRVMKELRRLGLIETNGGVHGILDWEALRETADFDAAYLHLRRPVAA